MLQDIIPYKDAIILDFKTYDGSMNGTSTELLIAIDEVWKK